MKNYRNLIESTRSRLNPDRITFSKSFNEELSSISLSDVQTFTRLAMKSVEPQYTIKTKEAGERVKAHLNVKLNDHTFKYQGSVMTNTHIKGYSDIDLLVISEKFYNYDAVNTKRLVEESKFLDKVKLNRLANQLSAQSYYGDSLADLRQLRKDSEVTLYAVYDICNLEKGKCIEITNQNLNRDVDIVIANWYDDVKSIVNGKGENRGIQIYNKDDDGVEKPDYPFLSIFKINYRSSLTEGRLKKMIRFLKTIKAESDLDIDLSSFDINAICYDISVDSYRNKSYMELVGVLYFQLNSILSNEEHARRLTSVDGKEHIFLNNNAKLEKLRILFSEVQSIYTDLKKRYIYG
jgi:predicted nucleotidyltransferase